MEGLSAADHKRIAEHLHLLVLTGTDERLASADRQGNLSQTSLPERITRGYEHEGLALVELDPFNMFGPGERFVNDGEAAALSAMANISGALRCAVRATSHVSKAVGRDGTSDAHSGRGGSAGGDNSRFVWNYWRHDGQRDKDATVPHDLAAAADSGSLFRLHIPKLTAAQAAWERVWIVRQGFSFTWHADALVTPQARREAVADSDAQRVMEHLRQGREQGGFYTVPELEAEAVTIGIGQKRVRAAVRRLQRIRRVMEVDLPLDMRKGGRKTYLEPVAEIAEPLDPSRPIAEQIAGKS
jgi:RecA-family ATPase